MPSPELLSRKVVIVGAGAVGATFAYALALQGGADEICLIDKNQGLAEGQVLDLVHGQPFYPPVKIYAGDENDYRDARVIVITAGAAQRSGESRLELLKRNTTIMESIIDDITAQNSPAVVVIVSNPVDVLTFVALRRSGWDRHRIIGSGTVLDSSRFRYLISRSLGVDVHNVHAYILGEHGDSELAAWSLTNIGGVSIDQYLATNDLEEAWKDRRQQIVEEVKNSAYHIIDYKGATNFAVGLALVRIVSAVLQDRHSVLTVSVKLEGEYGLQDVCLSVPCILSRDGMERVLLADLHDREQEALQRSAAVLRQAIDSLGPAAS